MDNNNMNSFNQGPGSGQGGPGNGQGGPGGPNGGQDPKRTSLILLAIAAVVTLLCVSFFMRMVNNATNQEITYDQFRQMVEDREVAEVTWDEDQIYIKPKEEGPEINGRRLIGYAPRITYYTGNADPEGLEAYLYENSVKGGVKDGIESYSKTVPDSSSFLITMLLTYIVPIALMWVLLSFLFRRMGGPGGPMGVGKSNAKVYVQKETGVTFKDVAGEDEAKESLQEVVDFLHNPQKYVKIGAKLPKGALLVGPPGTGKTLLARAVAGEAKVPFFSLTGSDFIELYVGVGASRVRDLFKEATKNAPCIIFIDEIDAIGRSRDSKYGGGNEEREQTLNQLLSEMDGFDTSKGILVIGATNRPEILDKALLRPGRFDRRIIVDKPDLKGRVEILKVHAKDVKMDETVDFDAIALATSGAVGSDLANMINEAAINAVKEGREYVCQKDLFEAVEQVLVGKEKKDRIMSAEERRIVSYHEVGHALVAALQKNSEPVQKITIVPRTMGALGYVMHVPEEEKFLNTQAELHDMLVGYLGGRAAEEIVFDTVTTGAANDIEQATNLARSMVTRFGMSKKFGLIGLESIESQYLEGRSVLNCSDVTAAQIDQEVMKILKDCYEEALALLSENREVMDKLASFLIEKETITGREFMKIYREIKGLPEPPEKEPEQTAPTQGSVPAKGQGGESKPDNAPRQDNGPKPDSAPRQDGGPKLDNAPRQDGTAGNGSVMDDILAYLKKSEQQEEPQQPEQQPWVPPTPGPEAQDTRPVGRFSGAHRQDDEK